MLKKVVLGTLALIVLVVVGAVIFLMTLDLNKYKPEIQAALSEQGIDSTFERDINLQFMPDFGLSLGGITLNDSDTKAPLAELDAVSVSVALMPLIKGTIDVKGIIVSKGKVFYHVDKAGKSNWDALINSSESETTKETKKTDGGETPKIVIKKLLLDELGFDYKDASTDTKLLVEGFTLEASNLNTQGKRFPLELSVIAQYADFPRTQLSLDAEPLINLASQSLSASIETEIALADNNTSVLGVTMSDTTASWGEVTKVTSVVSAELKNIDTLFTALNIERPETQNKDVLKKIGLNFAVEADTQAISVNQLALALDETQLTGQVTVSEFEKPKLFARLNGNSINIDHYLPPTSEETEETPPASEDAPPTPLPLDLLRSIAIDLAVEFEEIIVKNVDVRSFKLAAKGQKGKISVTPISAQISDGSVSSELDLVATQKALQVNFSSTTNGIDIGKLLAAVADNKMISGQLGSAAKGKTYGATDQELIKNLNLSFSAESEQLRLNPFNLVKQFCQAAALIEKKPMPDTEWPSFTDLTPVKLDVTLANQIVQLGGLNANVEKLTASAAGQFDMESGAFDFPIELSLADFASGLDSCNLVDEKWRKRIVPLRCKGTLESVGVQTCLPDKKRIGRMIEDQLKSKAKDKLKEKITDKIGTEKAKELENKFKNLFKR